MRPFLHDRVQRLDRLLRTSTAVLEACGSRALDLPHLVETSLHEATAEYGALGLPSGENELQGLQAQFSAARDGVDPLTSARVTVGRRELQRTVALRVLLTAAHRLRTDHDEAVATLAGAREQLAPLVLHALQTGLLVPGPDGTVSQVELEQLWGRLLSTPETAAPARRLALDLAGADVVLLLADLLASLGVGLAEARHAPEPVSR